jgi:hypothetical protein
MTIGTMIVIGVILVSVFALGAYIEHIIKRHRNSLYTLITRYIQDIATQIQNEHSSLEAMACVSSGKCRRTPSENTDELLNRIAMKELYRRLDKEAPDLSDEVIVKLMEAKEMTCDCSTGCDIYGCAEDEQNDAEVREEVEKYCMGCPANNGNCGLQANDTVSTCSRVERLKREAVTEANREAVGMLHNDNHHKANEKVFAATKSALKASIKET